MAMTDWELRPGSSKESECMWIADMYIGYEIMRSFSEELVGIGNISYLSSSKRKIIKTFFSDFKSIPTGASEKNLITLWKTYGLSKEVLLSYNVENYDSFTIHNGFNLLESWVAILYGNRISYRDFYNHVFKKQISIMQSIQTGINASFSEYFLPKPVELITAIDKLYPTYDLDD